MFLQPNTISTSLRFTAIKRIDAFSLVELSIVLAILGLLTGGVLAGQSLIHAAELRAVSTEYQQFQTAIHTFKEKYFAYPGDMTNATQFWGRADSGSFSGQCANPVTNQGTGTQTCNGNGNGKVGEWGAAADPNTTIYYEAFRFWQHLSNAKLINHTLTGVRGSASYDHSVTGENVPASQFGGGGWAVEQTDGFNLAWCPQCFNATYGNYFWIGRDSTNNAPLEPLFAPEEVWNIDKKIDDGMPAQGKLITNVDCTNAADQNDTDTDYDLQNSDISCAIMFTNVF